MNILKKFKSRMAALVGGVGAAIMGALNSFKQIRTRTAAFIGAMWLASFGAVDAALAQNTTIGAQVGTMSTEFSTMAGFASSTAMYAAALICFVAGVWYLWQSRQPENRESGKVAAGLAGLVLTGLFVTGGAWINKAANTTTGGSATISSTAGVVTFQ